jgi:hypothetical protein
MPAKDFVDDLAVSAVASFGGPPYEYSAHFIVYFYRRPHHPIMHACICMSIVRVRSARGTIAPMSELLSRAKDLAQRISDVMVRL